MTLAELQHIFRFQLTAEEEYTPPEQVEYLLINGQDKITNVAEAKDLEPLIILLDGYVFEGYRDRMPIFIIPEE
jgi:hypothetical protein